MAGPGRGPEYDRAAEEIVEAMIEVVNARTKRFTTSDGRLQLGKRTTAGTLPAERGGWRDHDHSGDAAVGQQLAEANTHQGLDSDPATAKHWTREMLQDMIALFLVDEDGDPFSYNDAGGLLTIPATPGSAWSVLTNGDPVSPELIFAGGDVIMIEIPR